MGDNGIVLHFEKPFSYTGENSVEFHCHGNYILLEKMLDSICCYGATIAKPGEFTYRSFLNNKIDLLQAESINSLIHSQTFYSAKSAQRSMKGDFSKIINNVVDALIRLRMKVESSIDFSDEDIDLIDFDTIETKILK